MFLTTSSVSDRQTLLLQRVQGVPFYSLFPVADTHLKEAFSGCSLPIQALAVNIIGK